MSDADPTQPNPPSKPDSGWTGLPDVDWYTPEPQQAPPAGGQHTYQYQYAQPRVPISNAGKPKSNLVMAILVTLFCCLPFGIVSIVYAAQVDSKWNAGDWNGALRASSNARSWAWAGIIGGILGSILYIFVIASLGTPTSGGRY